MKTEDRLENLKKLIGVLIDERNRINNFNLLL